MKYLYLFFTVLVPTLGIGQTTNSLSEMLWNRVNNCYSKFEDYDDDGIPEYNKIDDSKNGYLKIWGGWPTCGCSCSSTIGAYKNSDGQYILLQSDNFSCSWERKVSSNRELVDVLPINFGLNNFFSGQITEKIESPIFFIDFEIPRIGTDTKVKIELVPFGLKPDGDNLLCYEYIEYQGYSNCKSLYSIKEIAEEIQDIKTLDYLLAGDFNKISRFDNNLILKAIGTDDSRFKSIEEIQKYLKQIKSIYNIYSKLETIELTLGWNRIESRFYIKETGTKPENISFRDFLIKNKYWSWMC